MAVCIFLVHFDGCWSMDLVCFTISLPNTCFSGSVGFGVFFVLPPMCIDANVSGGPSFLCLNEVVIGLLGDTSICFMPSITSSAEYSGDMHMFHASARIVSEFSWHIWTTKQRLGSKFPTIKKKDRTYDGLSSYQCDPFRYPDLLCSAQLTSLIQSYRLLSWL